MLLLKLKRPGTILIWGSWIFTSKWFFSIWWSCLSPGCWWCFRFIKPPKTILSSAVCNNGLYWQDLPVLYGYFYRKARESCSSLRSSKKTIQSKWTLRPCQIKTEKFASIITGYLKFLIFREKIVSYHHGGDEILALDNDWILLDLRQSVINLNWNVLQGFVALTSLKIASERGPVTVMNEALED